MDFLREASPFEGDVQLRSISTGIVACDGVNADTAREVGNKILESMLGKTVQELIFKRKSQIVQLNTKQSPGGVIKQLDSSLLFQRFLLIARNGSISEEECFKFEMCSYPAALFDRSFVFRKPNKPELLKAVMAAVSAEATICSRPVGCSFVLDGGALLHRIPWTVNETYAAVLDKYSDYVQFRYPGATVVFDGYENVPSTKDMAHITRSRTVGKQTLFTKDMQLKVRKEEFLACKSNKQRFIDLLAEHLTNKNFTVRQARADADVLIVQTAIQQATSTETVLVGDDTDLFVLLCFHASTSGKQLYFSPEPKNGESAKAYNVGGVVQQLGSQVCKLLLFAHAVLRCDTTSRTYGIGKGVAVRKLIESKDFCQEAAVFLHQSQSPAQIQESGERALCMLYGAPAGMNLNKYQHSVFAEKVALSTSFVEPQQLPVTSAAAKFHSYRVYYQVQQWTGNSLTMDTEEWGWKLRDGMLYPVMTDQPVAPVQLLTIVKCGCKGQCDSIKCSCRKNGLTCTVVCKVCKGMDCFNVE